jgi:hypothetical protein
LSLVTFQTIMSWVRESAYALSPTVSIAFPGASGLLFRGVIKLSAQGLAGLLVDRLNGIVYV